MLVLAGDTIEVVTLKEKTAQRDRIGAYLQNLDDHYDKIIFVMGNHEHYHNSFIHTKQNLVTQFKKLNMRNIVVLEKETYEYEDVIFFGATMWTTFRNGNPLSMNECQMYMNDYRSIHVGPGSYQEKTYLTTQDTAAQCKMTLKKIEEFAALKTDKKKVLVTHMAPSAMSLDQSFRGCNTNDAYYEELFELLVDSDIKVACHGHIHTPVRYNIGNTLVVSNPRGYYSYEQQAYSYGFKMIEV